MSNLCCVYNKDLYYAFMEKYKEGGEFNLEEFHKRGNIEIKEAV